MPWTPPLVGDTASVVVKTPADFPAPVGGVITLPAGSAWTIHGTVDIQARIVCDGVVSIDGTSSETAFLESSTLGADEPLISSAHSLPLRNISLQNSGAGKLFSLDALANPGAALDWRAVNFINAQIGTVKDYNNWLYILGAWLSADGCVIDGTIGTVGVQTSLVSPRAGKTAVQLAATAAISRRFRVLTSAFPIQAGAVGIDVLDRAATFAASRFILETVAFSGAGTYLQGISASDNEAVIRDCTGVTNSADISHYAMTGNATATVIAVAGTKVKIAGATTDGPLVAKFDQTGDNTAQYKGVLTDQFQTTSILSVAGNNNQDLEFALYKNGAEVPLSAIEQTTDSGGKINVVVLTGVTTLATDDVLEIWGTNNSSTSNFTVTSMQVITKPLLS